jgi:hypothetical protein
MSVVFKFAACCVAGVKFVAGEICKVKSGG